MKSVEVVFNLYPFPDSNLFLPSANIVSVDQSGQLAHILQRATPATVGAYGIVFSPVQERLLELIDLLSVKSLEAKFKPPKSKAVIPLAKLLAEKEVKPSIESYFFRHLDVFLGEVVRNRQFLTLDAEKKTLAKDVLLAFSKEELIPHLSFKKTASGIEYRLQLGIEDQKWDIREHEVLPLTNTDPAWILVGYALFRVSGINGNMVRPFRQKELIQIPLDKEKVYFRQFIAKSIRRSRVEAEGFRVEKAEVLRRTRLEPTENILEQQWVLKPVFEYDGAEFQYGEKRDRVTSLDIPEEDNREITVHLICRDTEKEIERIACLQSLGLQEEYKRLALPGGLSAMLNWLARNRKKLEADGFLLIAPEVDGKTLALVEQSIDLRVQAAGDWFDVEAEISIGNYRFSFKDLLPNLKRRDPYYPLPDGVWFLIPDEWFTRYADLADALQLKENQWKLPKSLYTVLQESDTDAAAEILPVIDLEHIDYTPSADLKAVLRPYQVYGVKWLIGHYTHGFGACLADDMGLGKTLQTIALMLYVKENERQSGKDLNTGTSGAQLDLFQRYQESIRPLQALIILPASLVFNWQQEIQKFAPSLFLYAHVGPKRIRDARAMAGHDVVLTTYHTARQDLELLEKNCWKFIILDESQQIKNRESELSKVVRSLQGEHKISLSGTPIENSLADLWSQMEFINPATLGSYKSFREQFQIPIEKQHDAAAKARLFSRVSPFLLRRTKEEVAPDLPALTQQVFYTEMAPEQRKRYEEVKSAVRNEILSLFDDPKTRLQALQALTRLRQLANHPVLTDESYLGASGKMEDVLAQWDVIRRAGHKALFFSSFVQHLKLFKGVFERDQLPFAWLTGETDAQSRAAAVNHFQSEATTQAFFMTLGAGGVGLNLTAADYVFLLDPWWNPAKEDQAIARAHRIGQNKPVTAIRFIARDTVEEKILLLQEKKKALGKDLFAAGGEEPKLDRSDLELILG